jgi:hypothetical protein
LLANAVPPLDDNASSAAGRAMQNALAAVIAGELSAEEATEEVIAQLEG